MVVCGGLVSYRMWFPSFLCIYVFLVPIVVGPPVIILLLLFTTCVRVLFSYYYFVVVVVVVDVVVVVVVVDVVVVVVVVVQSIFEIKWHTKPTKLPKVSTRSFVFLAEIASFAFAVTPSEPKVPKLPARLFARP